MQRQLATATPDRPVRLGRYDVVGLIRAGGMGTVYEAIDREHGTTVALKTLTDLDAESLRRFKTEFRAVADLAHPNLVPLYELSSDKGLWFFTMERIDGVDFLEWLRGPSAREAPTLEEERNAEATTRPRVEAEPHVPLIEPTPTAPESVTRVREAFGQLVRGVRALHAAGLVHLDLKPSNVLVDRHGRVVVLDFGLVRPVAENAQAALDGDLTSAVSGTPAWMAPEQFAGENIGPAADWYAVGLMLYRALTGLHAFPPASVAVTWFAKMHLPPVPPDELVGGVPRDLSLLAMDLLRPEASERPDGALVAELVAGEASPVRATERAQRTELIGRSEERALLARAIERAHTRGAAMVHVRGPSGVGKSALLGELRQMARRGGEALVLRGRCYERESVPYKAFDEMFDELARRLGTMPAPEVERILPRWTVELARLFPVLGSVEAIRTRVRSSMISSDVTSAMEVRRRALLAARELVEALARERLVVLEIDDLQWADTDSVILLDALLAAPAPARLLVAASYRPHEASTSTASAAYLAATGELAARGDLEVTTIDIGPLSPSEARSLAAATLSLRDARSERLASRIADEAGGVPFFVEELARFANYERAAGREISTDGVTLDGLLAQRIEVLPPGERSLVEVLAVASSPIPLSVALAVAGIERGVLRALWTLRGGHFVRATGVAATDEVELHHDRMREALLASMARTRIDDRRVALGRALAALGTSSPWLFDAVRHLNGVLHRLDAAERLATARLNLAAGKEARRAAAFTLAFECYRAASECLPADVWTSDYDLALAVHTGAAESAYLGAAWDQLDQFITSVKANGRTILDQLSAWEVEIDALIARNRYADAVRVALEALRLLNVALPEDPGPPQIGEELAAASAALATVGPAGLVQLGVATDPQIVAAMRIEARVSSAAYFAKPALLPILACRLVRTSVEHGLCAATAYAVAIYGIVLNAIGSLRDAHTWGGVALELLERFEDRSQEARTRHVVHDLVCTWMVPLRSTLGALREVVEIGKTTGDLEYAGYAAHAYVHNSFYASMDLEPLVEDATRFGDFMRSQGQVNALHVHEPFERLLQCFVGRSRTPATLDGAGFEEARALAAAIASGSRSAQCIVPFLMGLVRYHFGSPAEASFHFERARPFLDGVASTWHHPMLHQYAALAIWALPASERSPALEAAADTSLEALRALASEAPHNFAHRASLVEGERARAQGDLPTAKAHFAAAARGASEGAFSIDLGLAHERWALVEEAAAHREHARAAYAQVSARAKVDLLG
ncbi:MAG: AAA family ATPase [Sandaracinus sp.]